jgi:hypothetical protein
VGSLTGKPGPRPCPYCGRRIEPRFALGPSYGRNSSPRHGSAVRHPPRLRLAVDRVGEDIRYLAGTVGWTAAIWKVTRTPILNIAVVLVCLLVVAFPDTHLVAKAVTAAVLAIQVGRLLFFFRQVRRHAARR